jgi:hypothetical protein
VPAGAAASAQQADRPPSPPFRNPRIVEERAAEILGAYMKAIAAGDWRASESLLTRVFGRPQEKLELALPRSVEEVERMSLAEVRAARRQLELIPTVDADAQ